MTAFPAVQAFIFDVGWGELVLIGIVALIVIGPKELPAVLRTVGQWMTKIRRMAAEFQSQFQEAMREAEMADLKQHFDAIQDAAKEIRGFDPAGHVRDQIEGAAPEKAADVPPPAAAEGAPQPTPAAAATETISPPTDASSAPPPAPAPTEKDPAASDSAPAPARSGEGPVAEAGLAEHEPSKGPPG